MAQSRGGVHFRLAAPTPSVLRLCFLDDSRRALASLGGARWRKTSAARIFDWPRRPLRFCAYRFLDDSRRALASLGGARWRKTSAARIFDWPRRPLRFYAYSTAQNLGGAAVAHFTGKSK
jgi:hypothetical protein